MKKTTKTSSRAISSTKHENVHKKIKSPVGVLTLVGNVHGLAAILWEKEKPRRVVIDIGKEDVKNPMLLKAEKQLADYFAKKRTKFDLPFASNSARNGTDFQKEVWNALLAIPFGKTVTYTDIAKKLGSPKAVRAVGGAVGRNPISIIVPCHRVIGTSGKLTGFAGGIKNKIILLELEGAAFKV